MYTGYDLDKTALNVGTGVTLRVQLEERVFEDRQLQSELSIQEMSGNDAFPEKHQRNSTKQFFILILQKLKEHIGRRSSPGQSPLHREYLPSLSVSIHTSEIRMQVYNTPVLCK